MTIKKTFNSFEEFVQQAKKRGAGCEKSSHYKGKRGFFGTDSFEEAVDLASRGWAEGAENALAIRARFSGLVSKATATTTCYEWDVTGEFLDVATYLSGEPECWGYSSQSNATQGDKVVKLVINRSISASVSQESIIRRGAAVLAAVDVLEASGKRVEVWIASGVSFKPRQVAGLECRVLVKSASQPLDSDRLAFAIINPATPRRLVFSIEEQNGFNPTLTYPAAVALAPDEIGTREAIRGKDFTDKEIREEVKWICSQAGIEIDTDNEEG